MKRKSAAKDRGGEAGPTTTTSGFKLPDGWVVEKKPRPSSSSRPGKIDKSYVETSTGKIFRSVPAVEQYLKEKYGVSTPKLLKQSPEKKSEKKSDKQITLLALGGSEFVLPDGWIVQSHRRSNCGTVDKYYIELETGKKFRSVVSVKRYLNEAASESATDVEPRTRRKSSSAVSPKADKNDKGIESAVESHTPRSTTCSPNFVLPDDWIVERHARRGRNSHKFNKCYIEPETGQRFRSLVSVERYLNEKAENEKEENEYEMRLKDFKRPKKLQPTRRSNSMITTVSEEKTCQEVSDSLPTKSEENTTTPMEVIPDSDSGPLEHSDTPKKDETGEETEAPKDDFGSPPSTVNWVLAGPAGDIWNPYLNDSAVPESTKQKWSETFISSLNDNEK